MAENDKPTALEQQGAGDPSVADETNTGPGNPEPEAPKNKAPEQEPEAKEEPKAEEPEVKEEDPAEDPEKQPLDNDVWGTTGDEVGDSVLELLQNSGISTDEAKSLMFDAINAGDITKVDEATLIEKVGKAKANLIMAGARDYVTRSKAKAETILTEVHTTVGGEDNWNAVTTWAKENVSEGELSEYRQMIDNGGAQARFAATELAAKYNAADTNTTLDTAANAEVIPDGKAAPSTRATTKAEYVSELEKAHDSGASEAVIQEIKRARAAGRAKGL